MYECERCGNITEEELRMPHRTAHICKDCQTKILEEVYKDLMKDAILKVKK